jgi:16S rRNA (guanine966-N2)-methyltransferase
VLTIRITSGTAKNKRLKAPAMAEFRAVQEVAKQAVFSILGDKVVGAQCADLFAGSGNMGLEALSRGAAWCDFVESDYEATEILDKNIQNCGFGDQSEVYRREAGKFAANIEKKYDLVFMDPFYHDTAHKHLMKMLNEIINPDGQVVILYGDQLNLDTIIVDTDFEVVTTRKFGASRFSILQLKAK